MFRIKVRTESHLPFRTGDQKSKQTKLITYRNRTVKLCLRNKGG